MNREEILRKSREWMDRAGKAERGLRAARDFAASCMDPETFEKFDDAVDAALLGDK